jgi:type III pantothenate kinase
MQLTIDIGNTRSKWALFEGDRLVQCGYIAEGLPVGWDNADIMVCATGDADLHALGLEGVNVHRLTAATPLPITLDYATPETLGPDRIAAACGAWKVGRTGCPKVIIDAGTCITIDHLDADGVYRGGAILPGIEMKFRALHTFTAKLPLLEKIDGEEEYVAGRSTRESMTAGVLTATRYEVEGFVRHYRQMDERTQVLLTGGDAERLQGDRRLQVGDMNVEPHLVMIGMNEIIKLKVEN